MHFSLGRYIVLHDFAEILKKIIHIRIQLKNIIAVLSYNSVNKL